MGLVCVWLVGGGWDCVLGWLGLGGFMLFVAVLLCCVFFVI